MKMKIRINGSDTEVAFGSTVGRLLDMLEIDTVGVAVEVNREIIPKRLLGTTFLSEGDRVEIVRMTGGG